MLSKEVVISCCKHSKKIVDNLVNKRTDITDKKLGTFTRIKTYLDYVVLYC